MGTPKRAEVAARWMRLLKALDPSERQEVVGYLLAVETVPVARESALVVLATRARTTQKEVTAWSITRHLVAAHGPLVRRFLDLVGLPHTNGEIHPSATSGSREDVRRRTALAAISAEFPARDAAYFLDAFESQWIAFLARLPALRREGGGGAVVAP